MYANGQQNPNDQPQPPPIRKALNELHFSLAALDLITIFYNTTFIFLFSALILLLLKLHWGYAFLPSTLALFTYTYQKARKNKLLRTEETTPELAEKLRTSADNLDKQNPLAEALHQEVIKDMKKIETAKFVDFKELTIKTVLLITVAFLTITLSYLNVGFDFPTFAIKAQEPLQILKTRLAGQDVPKLDTTLPEGNLSDILGNRSLALLGKKNLILQLNPLQSEVNLEETHEAEKKDFSPPPYPKEIYTTYDIAYNERIPKQNSEVIKTYFQEISR